MSPFTPPKNKVSASYGQKIYISALFSPSLFLCFLYFGPLTWSFCGSPPPVAWCDLPWTQFSPACEPTPFADGQFDPQAQPCRPLGSCPRPPPKDAIGSLVTALQHHCSHHGVHSRSLGAWRGDGLRKTVYKCQLQLAVKLHNFPEQKNENFLCCLFTVI